MGSITKKYVKPIDIQTRRGLFYPLHFFISRLFCF